MDILDLAAATAGIRHDVRGALDAAPIPVIASSVSAPSDRTILVRPDGSAAIYNASISGWVPLSFAVAVGSGTPSSPTDRTVWVRGDGTAAVYSSGAWTELSSKMYLGAAPSGTILDKSMWQDNYGLLHVRSGGAWVPTSIPATVTVSVTPPSDTTLPWYDPTAQAYASWNSTAAAWVRYRAGVAGAPDDAFISTSGAAFRNSNGDYYLTA